MKKLLTVLLSLAVCSCAPYVVETTEYNQARVNSGTAKSGLNNPQTTHRRVVRRSYYNPVVVAPSYCPQTVLVSPVYPYYRFPRYRVPHCGFSRYNSFRQWHGGRVR